MKFLSFVPKEGHRHGLGFEPETDLEEVGLIRFCQAGLREGRSVVMPSVQKLKNGAVVFMVLAGTNEELEHTLKDWHKHMGGLREVRAEKGKTDESQ
jgi:hypothetical protein